MSDFESKTLGTIATNALPVGQTEAAKSRSAGDAQGALPGVSFSLRRFRAEAEMEAISQALELTGWHRKRAAQLLRISYRCLLYKIHRYNITRAQTLVSPSSVPNVE